MLTLRNSVIDEKPFVIELGVMFHFTSTSLYRKFTFAIFFSGGAQIVNPTVHPVAGARVPVPRRQLPAALLQVSRGLPLVVLEDLSGQVIQWFKLVKVSF